MCVGWRPGEPVRQRNWDVVRDRYLSMGLPVSYHDSDPRQPLNLPQALNRAVEQVFDEADVFIVSDADTLIDPDQLRLAVHRAHESGRMVLPFTRCWYLRPDDSRAELPIILPPGMVHVVPRSAWLVLGGYDERFVGWSNHDSAMCWAAATFLRFERLAGDIETLWHPRVPSPLEPGWHDHDTMLVEPIGSSVRMTPLALRYRTALWDMLAMDRLLREAGRRIGK